MSTVFVAENRLKVLTELYTEFMAVLGIPIGANSKDTPLRYAKMMIEKTNALREEPPVLVVFPSEGYDEYIAIRDIPYHSMCSHHHVPFYGKVDICYWADTRLLGLSKFARVVTHFAAKPQIQEGMTTEVIEYLWDTLHPKGILVRISGEHLCMTGRGAKAIGSTTVTQQLKGELDKSEALRMIHG